MKYPEDQFDLESFKNETKKNRIALFRKKHAGAMKVITITIAVISILTAFLLYDMLNIAIDYLRSLGILDL